jgi:hypothetical protein
MHDMRIFSVMKSLPFVMRRFPIMPSRAMMAVRTHSFAKRRNVFGDIKDTEKNP